MLIRFVVSNFLSFNEECEFNMLAGSFKTHKHHVYSHGKVNVLKTAEIYGANGAGKSNLILAIDALKRLVGSGAIEGDWDINKFRLNKSNASKPIRLEIEFFHDKKIYSYGLNIQDTHIVEEWLYESGVTKEDRLIFERKISKTGNPTIKMAEKYRKNQKSRLLIELMEENLLKNNELLLSKSDNLKIKEIISVKDWFLHNLFIIFPGDKFINLLSVITSSEQFKLFANNLLNTFDTGVQQLNIESTDFEKYFGRGHDMLSSEDIEELNKGISIPFESETGETILLLKEKNKIKVKRVTSLHKSDNGENVSFELTQESDGTQRLLDFIPAFDLFLHLDVTILIDEIDQSLHPALLKALLEKLMTDITTKGQLIFTTHESNLLDLDIFRQDEIWFAEKDKDGSTHLYSLSDFKPRYDLDIRKGYLKGRFGAIPFLGNLKELNWQENHA